MQNKNRVYNNVNSVIGSLNVGENNPFYGKKHTAESKEAISLGNSKANVKLGKMVRNIRTGEIFESQAAAAWIIAKRENVENWENVRKKIRRHINKRVKDSLIIWETVTTDNYDVSRLVKESPKDYHTY